MPAPRTSIVSQAVAHEILAEMTGPRPAYHMVTVGTERWRLTVRRCSRPNRVGREPELTGGAEVELSAPIGSPANGPAMSRGTLTKRLAVGWDETALSRAIYRLTREATTFLWAAQAQAKVKDAVEDHLAATPGDAGVLGRLERAFAERGWPIFYDAMTEEQCEAILAHLAADHPEAAPAGA